MVAANEITTKMDQLKELAATTKMEEPVQVTMKDSIKEGCTG